MEDKILDELSDAAFAMLKTVDDDPQKLAEPFRTIVIISSAQGRIDNGGLAYFFESDFPHRPPYSDFVEAYRRIGAEEAADVLEKAAGLFPSGVQCPPEERRRILDENVDILVGFDSAICGNERVWKLLTAYAVRAKRDIP